MKPAIAIVLFSLQVFLILNGVTVFSKFSNPFWLFLISMSIPAYYLWLLLRGSYTSERKDTGFKYKAVGAIAGVVAIGIFIKQLQGAFTKYPDPDKGSDVIPQLDVLYTRFVHGVFPYFPLEQYGWHPYPVYMPLHWLPLGIPHALNIDVRWAGVIFLAIANGIWGIIACGNNGNILKKLVAIFLPAAVLWGFLAWEEFDFAVTLEGIVAAYYLVLAAGLAGKNLTLVIIGIIGALLSRYTLVFWLPLFFILLWYNIPKRKFFLACGAIIGAILVFYIIPFYLKDPSILSKGLAYHNMCYVNGWGGAGNPSDVPTFDKGVNFGYFIREAFNGDMQLRITKARVLQALVMIATVVAGLLAYRRWKTKIDHYDISLVTLYYILLLFFITSPVTFVYYYISLMVVSAVICSKIIFLQKVSAVQQKEG